MFQPVGGLAIELFLNGNVCHGCSWGGSVPVLFTGREPDHVTRTDLLDRTAPNLSPAATTDDDQRLPQRMRVPGRARTRLKGHRGADGTGRGGRLEQRVDAHRAGEVVGRAAARGLRTASLDLHRIAP